jgi:uncharacterized damage-inducible protein DinB
MTYYGARQLADSFRTVRKNTITMAEEIPADQYGFRPVPGVRSVAELLAHIAVAPRWNLAVHGERLSHIDFEFFGRSVARAAGEEQILRSKEEILEALREGGATYVAFLEGLTEDVLAEPVTFPPPVQPASKSRFEMILGSKEHEMHHRGQLMLIQRQLGMVPHITRQREALAAQAGKA